MVTVYIGAGPPCQVDGFGDGAERSVKGALHLRPNSLATITHDELEHVQRSHSEIQLRVVRVDKPSAVEEKLLDVIALPPVEEAEPVAGPESEPESDEPKQKGRSRRSRKSADAD